jgi:hypothetical protein
MHSATFNFVSAKCDFVIEREGETMVTSQSFKYKNQTHKK